MACKVDYIFVCDHYISLLPDAESVKLEHLSREYDDLIIVQLVHYRRLITEVELVFVC